MRGGLITLLLASSALASSVAVNPRNLPCVPGVNDAAVCAVQSASRAGAVGTTPVDWSGSFHAIWRFETDGTSTGSCTTSACNLSQVGGTVAHDAGVARDGRRGLLVATQGNRWCSDAACGATTDGNGSTEISLGCMAKLENAAAVRTVVENFETGAAGYLMQVQTDRKLRCTIGAGTDVSLNATTAMTVDRWTFLGCALGTIGAVYIDGTGEGAGLLGNPASDGAAFNVSANGSTTWRGGLDLCFLRRGALTTGQWCRIAMCGITGVEFGCTCASGGTGLASYAQRGRYDVAGMTCTPSDCTASAP